MGQFVVRWLALVIVNVCTKYEVSTFGHSKDIKGVPKFRTWSRDQRVSRNALADKIWRALLYPFESYGGVPSFKFWSRDPDHAHFRG